LPTRASPTKRGQLDQDFNGFGASPRPVRDFEALAIASYQVRLREGLFLIPNLQYIIHPGGGYMLNEMVPLSSGCGRSSASNPA
jgi:porin